MLFAVMLNDEDLAEVVDLGRAEPQYLAGAPDGNEFQSYCFCRVGDPQTYFAVDIDHRASPLRQKLGEEAEFLREVVFDARVIVQMIAREIGEGASGKFDPVNAA